VTLLKQLLVAGSIFVIALAPTGCATDANSNPPEEEEPDVSLIPVEVDTAAFGDVSALFTGTATLEAEGEAEVVAKASGVVQRILVEEGDFVRAGQVLATLDSERSSLELTQMEANLQRMENDFKRNEELFNKQLISAETYEQVKFQFESQKAAVDLARLQIQYASIRTPIAGVVSERHVKIGNMIAQNQATFKVTDFDPLLAPLYVPERELAKLKPGQKATLVVDAVPGAVFDAAIKRISPVVDPSTGTFKVTVEVRDRTKSLKPGMLARINITYDEHKAVVLVPKEAVLQEDSESAVFVVVDSVAYRRTVETGYSDQGSIEIIAGISADEVVVTTGQTTLKDSSKVEVIF
jgi:membrane fusion protein (multidrug efflux system)